MDPLQPEPMSPQEFNRGLTRWTVIEAVIIVIGVLPLVLSPSVDALAWFAEPAFGQTSRAIIWLVVAVLIGAGLLTRYFLSSAPRVRSWRAQQDGSRL